MNLEMPPRLSRREYMERMIRTKENENVGAQVEYDLAMSMSLTGKHAQKFEQAMVMFKGRIAANSQVIEIYKRLLEKEPVSPDLDSGRD